MDFFSRKSLSKYLMNTTDFSDAWPKYDGDYSKL
jgi:hypothetical protein